MSMHLIYGGSGSGKTELLCQTIIEEAIRHPEKQYLVIVPEQATLQTQMLYVNRHPKKGLLNIDVLSFQRLAYRVREEIGEQSRIVLRDTGKNLLLRKAAGDISDQLTVFAGNFRRIGYVSEMKSLLSELAQYRIGEEQLQEILQLCPERGSLHAKLTDISILQKRFTELMGETYVTGEELLEQLARSVCRSSLLKDAVLAFDGFTGFTPVQEVLLEELFKAASDLYFTAELSWDADPDHDGGVHSLFHLSQEMLGGLRRIAQQTHTEIIEPVIRMPEKGMRFRETPELEHLERYLFRRKGRAFAPYECAEDGTRSISVHSTRNPMEEASYLAGEIMRLVREEGCRYRDIAITVSNMDAYRDCLTAVFAERNIPYFMDHKRNALHNAAVDYVRAAVSMAEERMSYESVFRFLKSGFYPMEPDDLFLMENYVLAMDVKGFKRWEEPWIRKPESFTPEEVLYVNDLRAVFMEQMGDFLNCMRKRGRTVRSCTEALYELLVGQEIQKQLQERQENFEEEGQAALGREYAQIYRLLIDMFDEFVSLLGEESVSLQEYRELLDAGLAELRIGVIPPGQDQLLIGDLERSRIAGVKYLFCAGLNDIYLPGIAETKGILNDRDREFLSARKFKLAPTQLEKIATQRYYLYLNLTKPSEHLYLSYSKVDMEGKTLQPAFYLREIERLYTRLAVREEADICTVQELPYAQSESMRYLAKGLLENTAAEDPVWKQLYAWYTSGEDGAEKVKQLVDARFLKNREERLSVQRARQIYGTLLNISITRLEKYASCPYAHFLQYGLRLKEREEFGFELVDEGSVMHDALYRLGQILRRDGYSWNDAPADVLQEACVQAMEGAVAGYGNAILTSTARRQYMVTRMEEKLEITAQVLQQHLKMGGFRPEEYEWKFGGSGLKVLEMDLDEETKLSLRGTVDRLDIARRDDGTYIKILDYKNGSKTMDLSAVYNGLDLQLFLYLKAAKEHVRQEEPQADVHTAGVLYYHVLNPVLKREDLSAGADAKMRMSKLLEELKPQGRINSDNEVPALFDREFYDRDPGASPVMPVSRNANGSLSKKSSVLTEEEFDLMEKHLIRTVREQGREILSGEIDAAPVHHGTTEGCANCKYQQVCGFRKEVPGYEERMVEKLKDEEILLRLHAEEGNNA